MTKYGLARDSAIIAILLLWMSACSSGSGGLPPTAKVTPSGLSVAITSPGAATVDTTDESMNIGGTAASASGIAAVSWQSDQGAKGTASGTDSWQIDSIPLELGANTIVVTATDTTGEATSVSMVINRESTGTGSVTLSWQGPTERTDGTPLTDLAGYRIAYGRMSGVYDYTIDVDNPGIVTYMVESLVPGDWYFTLTAYDAGGVESAPSNEVSRSVL